MITVISNALKAAGAEVWAVNNEDPGYTIRARWGREFLRIILPAKQAPPPSPEKNSHMHLFRDLDELESWLLTLKSPAE